MEIKTPFSKSRTVTTIKQKLNDMPAIKIKFKYTQRIQYIRSATVEVKRLEAYDNHSQGSKVKINSTIKGKQLPNLRKRDQP